MCHIENKSTDYTKKVDYLAKFAAKHTCLNVDTGYIKPIVCKTAVSGPTEIFKMSDHDEIIKIFEHTPVSRRKDSLYKIKFEIMKNGVKEKYYAYAPSEINKILDRGHYYKVKFNSNKKNPIIEKAKEVKIK